MVEVGARAIGARVLRVEDPRILTGRGRYIDDITLPGMLHAAFKRSTVPHGRLVSVDVSAARELPGVVAVYTGEDIARLTHAAAPGAAIGMHLMPGLHAPAVFALATDKVRYVGDPIALVVADDRYIAEDALELIEEDIDWLDPVVSYADALDVSKPPLFDELDDNVAFRSEMTVGDVDGAFAKADRVVQASIWVHRHQPVPMETRGLDRVVRPRRRAADHPLVDPVTAHDPDPPPRPDRRADGEDPRARRRRRGRVRPEERGTA